MNRSRFLKVFFKTALAVFALWMPSKVFAISTATVPSGNMTSSGTWALTGAATRSDAVNDPIGTPDDDTTYISGTAVGTVMFSYPAFSIPTGAVIQNVSVYYRTKDATSGANNLRPVLRVNGSTRSAVGIDPGAAYSTWIGTWTVNPNTAAAWTVADVNGTGAAPLQGFGLTTLDVTPNMRITQIYIQVTYDHLNRYWISTITGNWASATNWSASSGGPGGASVPASTHSVIFDGVNGSVGISSVNAIVSISSLTMTSGYSGSLNFAGAALTISTAITQSGGTISLGSAAVTLQGDLAITGGNFETNASTITLTLAKAQSVRTSGETLANVVINKTANSIASLADQLTTQGQLSVSAGSFTTTSSNYGISVGSDVLVNGGTFVLNASTVNVNQDWLQTSGVFSSVRSTVNFIGSGTYWINGGTQPFTHVNFNNAGGSWNLRGPLFTRGFLTLTDGSLATGNNNFNITVGSAVIANGGDLTLNNSTVTVLGSWDWNSGTFNAGNSTVTFSGTIAKTIAAANSPFAHVTFNNNNRGGTYTLQEDLTVNGNITFSSGAFNTSGSNYAVTVGSDVFVAGGTLTLNASMMNVGRSWTRTAGLFSANTSTVNFNGAMARTINIAAQPFNHVWFNSSNATTTLTAALFTMGHFTVESGSITTGANFTITVGSSAYLKGGSLSLHLASMSVAGNWINAGTDFNEGRSTVTLTHPTAARLTGSTTFYGLRSLTAGQTITSQANSTIGVTGYLTLTGAVGNEINLRSSSPGTYWYLIATGTNAVTSVDAQDSNAVFGPVIRAYPRGIDSGNNVNWAFTDQIRYWTSNVTGYWNSSANWSMVSGGSGGATVPSSTHSVVFDGVNGDVGISSVNATVSISSLTMTSGYTGSLNFAGAGLTISTAIVQSGGTIRLGTAAVTLQGDLAISGGAFEANASTITLTLAKAQTIQTSGESLANVVVNKTVNSIASLADQLTLQGQLSVTAGSFTTTSNDYGISIGSDVRINGGTFVLNASTVNANRHWLQTAGVFSSVLSTVNFIGSGTYWINGGTQPFTHVNFNNSGGTWNMMGPLFTRGILTLTDGTLGTGNNNFNITVGSDLIANGGELTLHTSTVNVLGSWDWNSGTFNNGGSTVTFNGTGAETIAASASPFTNVVINGARGTYTLQEDFTTNGNLTLSSGAFNSSGSNYAVTVGSDVFVAGGTLTLNASMMNVGRSWTRTAGLFSANTSTVNFNGAMARTINIAAQPFNHVWFNSSNATSTLTGALFTMGHFTVESGSVTTGANFNITVGSTAYLDGGSLSLHLASMSVEGNWINTGTDFNEGRSTVTLDHPTAVQLVGSTTFYGLRSITPGQTITSQANSTIGVTGYLTLTGAGGNEINLRSSSPGTYSYLIATGTNTITSVDAQDSNAVFGPTIRAFPTGVDSGHNVNWAFTDAIRYWTSSVPAVWSSSSSWALSSGGPGGATVPTSTHTAVFDGAFGDNGRATVNLGISISTIIVTSAYTNVVDVASAPVTVSAGLYQNGGTISMGTAPVILQGQLDLGGGTFISGNSTFTLTGSSSQTLTATNGDLGNLVLNKTNGIVALGSDIALDGAFTLTAGTFTTTASNYDMVITSNAVITGGSWAMNGSTVSLNGSWTKTAGSLTFGTSVLRLQGSLNQILTPSATDFYHLTVNKTGGSASSAADLGVDGNLTLQSGTFAPGSRILTISGSWLDTGGSFTATGSTVVFNGAGAKTISGDTAFEVLRATTTGITLNFGNGNTFSVSKILEFRNTTLQSNSAGLEWFLNVSASSRTLLGLTVQDSDASGGILLISTGSTNVSNNTNWDFGQPNAITILSATQGVYGATIQLSWTATGDDGAIGTLNNSTFTVQYTTDTTFARSTAWSPTAVSTSPAILRLHIATTSVTAGSARSTLLSNLVSGATYYSRLWTLDDANLYSPLSLGATNWATVSVSSVSLSTDTLLLGALNAGTTVVYSSSITVTNVGNTIDNYKLSITTPAIWVPTSGGAGVDQFRLTGIFKDSLPVSANFDISNDVITGSTFTATTAIYSLDADADAIKGINVSPGEKRGLWFRIEMPPVSSTTTDQVIRVNVTAGP